MAWQIRLCFLVAALALCLGQLASGSPATAQIHGGFLSKLRADFSDNYREGFRLYDQGDYEGALAVLNVARGQDPKHPTVRALLADIYRRLHRYSEAESELMALVLIDPKDDRYQLALAELYVEQGKFQSAIGAYQQVIGRSPDNPSALLGLAMAFEGTNDLNSAQDTYNEVKRRYPGSRYARSADSRLARLEKAQKADSENRYFPIDPDLGEAGLGWWDLKRMPIHVYVDSGEGIRGYRPEMRVLVNKALEAWSGASAGAISFEIDPPNPTAEAAWKALDASVPILKRLEKNLGDVPDDPVKSQLHIHWTHNLTGGLGLTWTSRLKDGNPVLKKAHIWISTEKMADASPVPDAHSALSAPVLESQDRMLEEVMIHELGHALGLPHSSNPNDIMCSGIYGMNATDRVERRQLSQRDIRSLAEHYNNFEGNGMPVSKVAQLKQETSQPPGGGASEPAGSTSGGTAGGGAGAGGDTAGGAGTTEVRTDAADTSAAGGEKREEQDAEQAAAGTEGEGEGAEAERPGARAEPLAEGQYDPIKEALFYITTKRYDKAVQSLNKVLSANPNNPQAHYVKGVAFVLLRQYAQAASEYKEVMRLTPHSELGQRAAEGLKKIRY